MATRKDVRSLARLCRSKAAGSTPSTSTALPCCAAGRHGMDGGSLTADAAVRGGYHDCKRPSRGQRPTAPPEIVPAPVKPRQSPGRRRWCGAMLAACESSVSNTTAWW
eukprot:7376957-Prymnesium_polylepis.1